MGMNKENTLGHEGHHPYEEEKKCWLIKMFNVLEYLCVKDFTSFIIIKNKDQ